MSFLLLSLTSDHPNLFGCVCVAVGGGAGHGNQPAYGWGGVVRGTTMAFFGFVGFDEVIPRHFVVCILLATVGAGYALRVSKPSSHACADRLTRLAPNSCAFFRGSVISMHIG